MLGYFTESIKSIYCFLMREEGIESEFELPFIFSLNFKQMMLLLFYVELVLEYITDGDAIIVFHFITYFDYFFFTISPLFDFHI